MTLTIDRDGERLDSALSRLVPELTRSQAQRLIEQGAVTQAGRPVKKNEKLPAGTALELEIPEVREAPIAAQDIPLEVCYEDADVIVVNKPKGLVVHPAPGHADGTLVNALLAHCGDSLSGIGGEKRPGIVHRIDKDTSGLIIAAKNDLAHAALAAQLGREHFNYTTNDEWLAACQEADLLILDDLGTEYITPLTISVLYELINTRMLTHRPTIYTTNITDQTVFMARYTEKVASRMLGGCKMFKFFGTDQRLK